VKFHKMLKKMRKDKEAKFESYEAECYSQDYESILHWICTDGDYKNRINSLEKFIKAKDWKREIK
jgi:hypothetical protein